ncbi:PAS domain S-box protein [Paenibacillus sp. GCM10027627]|uniref:PAS domain S-box protein n=1 Tax=unclassified Paenibacillus TaxID=185978 RepID=UPI00363170DE
MSIKAKLSFSISIIVAIILILNVTSSYISSQMAQEVAQEQQTETIARQLVLTLETLENTRRSMDLELGKKLRLAAILAEERLNPDIRFVSNEQLRELSNDLGLDDITLWQRIDGEVVSVQSSNPEEIGLSSKTWDYWDKAFHQLLDLEPVTVSQGKAMKHYWTGPINYASSDPTLINKWGYYYDGSTNYMINTIINTDKNFQYDLVNGTNDLIHKLLAQQSSLLEISGFDPQYFGTAPIIKMKKGVPVYNLDVRDVPFGAYTYRNVESDLASIKQALETGETITETFETGSERVMRSFVPIHTDKPYVIGVAFDMKALQKPLYHELITHSVISLALVLLTMVASYFIAGYMLRSLNQIFHKVNSIAEGDFSATISIRNKDELGLLAARVNTMGVNLLNYTTQLKDTARELQSTQQYLESFFRHTSNAIHVIDLEGRIMQVNNAFESIYGWKEAELVGRHLPNLPPQHRAAYDRLIQTVLRGGSVTDYETTRYTKNGDIIDVSITISAIRDEQGSIVAIAAISRNITSRKQAEEMIRRSEKLAVVGQLAAGVAHEVRNPLTTLRGFVQLHKQTGRLSETYLDIMLSELDQINMIVSEFLVLAKPQAICKSALRVDELISDIVMLMDPVARMSHVALSVSKLADIPEMDGVANQLKQVFVNIVKNGMEAMPDGGQLVIELDRLGENEIAIRFIDTGYGITEDDLKRLGEPFFTKKDGGNGLGIMVCQQIIVNHKGSMTYSSEIGIGTCVEIRLPLETDSDEELE